MWWLFLIIFVLLFFVFEVIWVMWPKNDKFSIKNTILAWLSIVFTLFGIMFAIADDYLSQYDYNPCTIFKYEKYKSKGVVFDDLIEGKTKLSPEYIFAFDVSQSTNKTIGLSQGETDTINEQIELLKATGWLKGATETDFGFDKNKKTINYIGLLKVRLLCSLYQLDTLQYENLNYSIVCFADQCSEPLFPSDKSLRDRLRQSFITIDTIQSRGKNSDFNCLINHINKHYLYDNLHHPQIGSYRSSFERRSFIIVFLTDFLHDVKNENLTETTIELEKNIKKLGNADANLTLYMLANTNKGLKSNNNVIKVDDLLKRFLSKDVYQNVDILSFKNSIDYSLLLTKPFPFYYSSSLYATSMKTCMVFNETKGLSFCVQDLSDFNRQEIRLYQRGTPSRMSQLAPKISIKEKKIELEIFGYIPAPHSFPDIMVDDASKRVRYVLPVAFYKNFPISCLSLLVVITLIVGYLFVLIVITTRRNNTKNGSVSEKKEGDSEKKEGDSGKKEGDVQEQDILINFI